MVAYIEELQEEQTVLIKDPQLTKKTPDRVERNMHKRRPRKKACAAKVMENEQARNAARSKGLVRRLWVERQLRETAQKELDQTERKKLAAEILCTKVEIIESALVQYIHEQDKSIASIQQEIQTRKNVSPSFQASSGEKNKVKGGSR